MPTQTKQAPPPRATKKAGLPSLVQAKPKDIALLEEQTRPLTLPAMVLSHLSTMRDDEERSLAFVELMEQVHEHHPSLISTEEISDDTSGPMPDVKTLEHELAVVSLTTAYAFGGNKAEEEFQRVFIHYMAGLNEVEQDHLRVRMRNFSARFVNAAQVVSQKLS